MSPSPFPKNYIRSLKNEKKPSVSSARARRRAKNAKHMPDSRLDLTDIPEATDEQLRHARRVGRPATKKSLLFLQKPTQQIGELRLLPQNRLLLCRSAIAFCQPRELCRQVANGCILRYVRPVRWSNGFPSRFCAPKFPANFFIASLRIHPAAREEDAGCNFQVRPAVVALDFHLFHFESLKNHQRKLHLHGVIVAQDASRGVAQFGNAIGDLAARRLFVSCANDNARWNFSGRVWSIRTFRNPRAIVICWPFGHRFRGPIRSNGLYRS